MAFDVCSNLPQQVINHNSWAVSQEEGFEFDAVRKINGSYAVVQVRKLLDFTGVMLKSGIKVVLNCKLSRMISNPIENPSRAKCVVSYSQKCREQWNTSTHSGSYFYVQVSWIWKSFCRCYFFLSLSQNESSCRLQHPADIPHILPGVSLPWLKDMASPFLPPPLSFHPYSPWLSPCFSPLHPPFRSFSCC